MDLNEEAKKAVGELGDAINSAIENSSRVAEAIDRLRELGYEPNLSLKLEISLYEIVGRENPEDEIKLNLTDEDLKTLRRMKIRFE